MLDQLGWASLQNRRQMLRLNMMYKIHNGLVAMDPQDDMTPITRKNRHVHALGYEVPPSTNTHSSQEQYGIEIDSQKPQCRPET